MSDNDRVRELQEQLRLVEAKFEPLRRSRDETAWAAVESEAAAIRRELVELTGDPYGRPKVRREQAPDSLRLNAPYNSPGEIPADVLRWVRRHAALLTSDATDAVRWARIIDTLKDDRYPQGNVTVCRAVAEGHEIRPGDWVTLDRRYAEDHLRRYLNGRGQVLEMIVDGSDVLVSPSGNAEEAIYAPRQFSGPVSLNPENGSVP
jgi:hypothetical protein